MDFFQNLENQIKSDFLLRTESQIQFCFGKKSNKKSSNK